MTQHKTLIEDRADSRTNCSDTVELPRRNSVRDDFFLTLKLIGIAAAILSAIWIVEYLRSG